MHFSYKEFLKHDTLSAEYLNHSRNFVPQVTTLCFNFYLECKSYWLTHTEASYQIGRFSPKMRTVFLVLILLSMEGRSRLTSMEIFSTGHHCKIPFTRFGRISTRLWIASGITGLGREAVRWSISLGFYSFPTSWLTKAGTKIPLNLYRSIKIGQPSSPIAPSFIKKP